MVAVSGEEAARDKQASNTPSIDEAVTDDPTGGTHEQVAAKIAANNMGDQDEANTSYTYPPDADQPTAQNVRRYPELFDQSVIDSFNVDDTDVETQGADEVDYSAEPVDPADRDDSQAVTGTATVESTGFGSTSTKEF